MRMNKKSHGRKTDQETQSPMLKIFKDIIQRDKDPEKTTLLKDNHEERKKRHYTSSKPKNTHKSEVSSSDRSRKTVSYKSQETRNLEYDQCRPRSGTFQGDRKDSWWFWGEKNSNRDTRSCVSCALKKLGGSEYFCVGCLLLIFAVSVAVAFMLVFRSVPTIAADVAPSAGGMLDSDRLRRKMEALNDKKVKKFGKKADSREKREWDNTVWKHLEKQGSLTRSDFGRSGLNDLVSIEGNEKSNLPNILGGDKNDEFQNNEKLRDFFKKLAQADAQIRILKKGFQDPSLSTSQNEMTLNNILDRSKRSVKLNRTKLGHFNKLTNFIKEKNAPKRHLHRPFYILKRGKKKDSRNKRFSNDTEPTGFYIEKKEMLVQYLPLETRKIPKCSHSSKESKSHEKLLKHPFYKNTQRLDELLDQFTAKNFDEIVDNPYAFDLLVKKKKEKCKHPKTKESKPKNEHKTTKPKKKTQKKVTNSGEKVDEQKISDEAIRKLLQPLDASEQLDNNAKKLLNPIPKEKVGVIGHTKEYDIILSISTVLSSVANIATTPMPFERNFIFRKLMQMDEEEDENIGYEDLKEVLAEDLEAHDERDSRGDRNKREDPNQLSQIPNLPNPPSLNNPNWKGPMPLYPDEINSMIKQAAISANKLVYFKNKEGKEIYSPKESLENTNDVQYIEEYFNSKYDRLVNMAQAYSDYGVLEGKRNGVGTEKADADKSLEHRVKLSANGVKFGDRIFGRTKKDVPHSEGIRFELRPTAPSREDTPLGMSKLLHKHVQISGETSAPSSAHPIATALPVNPDIDFMFSPTKYDKHLEGSAKTKQYKSDDGHGISFSIHRNRRSLKSFNEEDGGKSYENDIIDEEQDKEKSLDIINEGQTGVIFDNLKANNTKYNVDVKRENVKKDVKVEDDNFENKNKQNIDSKTDSSVTMILIDHKEKNTAPQRNQNVANSSIIIEQLNLNKAKHTDVSALNNQSIENNRSISNFNISDGEGTSVSDFFMMLSNFFSFLEDFDADVTRNASLNPYFVSSKGENNNLKHSNVSNNAVSPKSSDLNANIGYRTRLLLSINESTKIDNSKYDTTKELSNAVNDTAKTVEAENSTIRNDAIITKVTKAKLDAVPHKDNSVTNKTLVKRSVDDSNLIFWNDIYDDEYGVRVEPEDNVRDKQSVPKTSGTWFKDKLKRLTDNLRKQPDKEIEKRRVSRDVPELRKIQNSIDGNTGRVNKRDLKLVETDEYQPEQSFATLNANMKEICRKAARAVQQTKNLKVNEDTKEYAVGTSLMQQLVKLMTDLVDYQVQQKTCIQLPPDLRSFLEWLTEPGQGGTSDAGYKRDLQDDLLNDLDMSTNEEKSTEHYLSMEMITPTTSEREEIHPEERSDCLGTLHAVQDLLLQFEELSDEDKSKMVGIKEYLDNQLDYLQKYIVSIDDLSVNQNRDYPRFKRNAFGRKTNEKRNKTKKETRIRQRMKNILKFHNKKHTRTSRDSFARTTEVSQESRKEKAKNYASSTSDTEANESAQMKRNLKDVYFKAVADAKKSTVKSFEKY